MKKWFVGIGMYWNEWLIYDTRDEAIQAAKEMAYENNGCEVQVFESELCGSAFIPEPEAVFEPVKE